MHSLRPKRRCVKIPPAPPAPCIRCGALTRGRFGSVACRFGLAVEAPWCCECATSSDLRAADDALQARLRELGLTIAVFEPIALADF
jgi:hypothetical protein